MGKSKIDWTEYTWNPIVGCSKISPGCAHCYAEKMAGRLAAMEDSRISEAMEYLPPGTHYERKYGKVVNKNGWTGNCYLSESELEKPIRWKKSRVIFVSSMGDLFHENVPFEWIDRVVAEIAMNSRHTFIILTKRPEKMAEYFNSINAFDNFYEWFCERIIPYGSNYKEIEALPVEWPLPNLYLGVTAENQEMADLRIPILLQISAALHYVSLEPLLSEINISKYLTCIGCGTRSRKNLPPKAIDCCPDATNMLDWVILGMETGHGARTFLGAAEAIVNVKDQCVSAGVPFFYKGPYNIGTYIDEPGVYIYRNTNESKKQYKIDGIEYRQFPEEK